MLKNYAFFNSFVCKNRKKFRRERRKKKQEEIKKELIEF